MQPQGKPRPSDRSARPVAALIPRDPNGYRATDGADRRECIRQEQRRRVAYNNFARGGKKPKVVCIDQMAVLVQLQSSARGSKAGTGRRNE